MKELRLIQWHLSRIKDGLPYEGPKSLATKSPIPDRFLPPLQNLPSLARYNFPITCETIFRKNFQRIEDLPDQVTAVVEITATFEKAQLLRITDPFEVLTRGDWKVAGQRKTAKQRITVVLER